MSLWWCMLDCMRSASLSPSLVVLSLLPQDASLELSCEESVIFLLKVPNNTIDLVNIQVWVPTNLHLKHILCLGSNRVLISLYRLLWACEGNYRANVGIFLCCNCAIYSIERRLAIQPDSSFGLLQVEWTIVLQLIEASDLRMFGGSSIHSSLFENNLIV